MMDLLLKNPLGSLMGWLLSIAGNYGLALILFTVITKIVLLPLGIIQQKTTIKQTKMRPREAAIRKKYGNDKEKLNMAIAQLYSEHKVNPAAGCLPLLIQFPILIGLYDLIRKPLTYVLKFSTEKIASLDAALLSNGFIQESFVNAPKMDYNYQVRLAEGLYNNFSTLVSQGVVDASVVPINYNFLGMNLSQNPTIALNLLILIPFMAGFTAFLQSWYQMRTQPLPQGSGSMKGMMYTMPLISVWFTFSMPAGIGLYWSISNVCALFQTMFFNAVWSPRKALAEAEAQFAVEEKENKKKKSRDPEPVKEDPSLAKYMPKSRIPDPIDDEV